METQLVSTGDAERLAKTFGQNFEVAAAELDELYQMLRSLPLSRSKAELALEVKQKATRYIQQIDSSEPREIATNLDKAHKIFVRAITRWRKRGELPRKLADDVLSDWENQRLRNIEEDRRKREAEANAAKAKEREAELQHLREVGKSQEAQQLELTPVRPVSVPFNPDAGKTEGVSMVRVWVPECNEQGEIVFDDEAAYRAWANSNVAFWPLMSHEYGKLKRLLTDNNGMLQPPGLKIVQKFEPRTRRESDE